MWVEPCRVHQYEFYFICRYFAEEFILTLLLTFVTFFFWLQCIIIFIFGNPFQDPPLTSSNNYLTEPLAYVTLFKFSVLFLFIINQNGMPIHLVLCILPLWMFRPFVVSNSLLHWSHL